MADWMAGECLDDDELASRASVSRSTISRIRRGVSRPSPSLAAVLIEISDGKLTLNGLFRIEAAQSREAA